MKFGKVDTALLDAIDFELPAIHPQTLDVLSKVAGNTPTSIKFGATGWGTDEWKGTIYPEKLPKSKYLHQYAKSFDTIELNTTHYNIPKINTILKWKEAVPSTFKFCPKVLQYISHSKKLGTDTDRINSFCDAIAHLEDNLGMSFMQLPPYWDITRLPILETFLQQWPSAFPLAIEVRHPSFYESRENTNRFFDLLSNYDTSSVITDVAGVRPLVHLRLVTPTLFVRFVGNALHPTDYVRLDDWSQKIEKLSALGLQTAYFFPHQPENILPPETADYMIQKLKSKNNNITLKEISWSNKDKQLLLF